MKLLHADKANIPEILSLYESAKGKPFCTWDEYYPSIANISEDLDNNSLYIIRENDEIIAAVSVVPENELDGFPVWNHKDGASEIARVTVKKEYRGKGLAALMLSELFSLLKAEGCRAIHLSAAKLNVPAVKTYKKLGFSFLGEAEMYDNLYYLCEKTL